jgi:MtaA/CmuA family methyltransferase
MNGRERILACFAGESTDSLPFMPITMMFAADRVGIPYGAYATNYRNLVEGQLRTADEFDIDYVSAISDPAREAADCGARIEVFEDQPPAIIESDALLADKTRLASLCSPDPYGGGRMHDRVLGVEALSANVGGDKLVEGWVEGPIAEAADLRGINHLMMDFLDDPVFVRDLFEFVLETALAFGRAQIEAGANLIGIGDAAASLINRSLYDEFVLPYERRLIDGLREAGGAVRLHICGNTKHLLDGIAPLNCQIVDLDSLVEMADARALLGPDRIICGNIDPVRALRNSDPTTIQEDLAACRQAAGAHYIVGAGCEVPRDTPPENFHAMRKFARSTCG